MQFSVLTKASNIIKIFVQLTNLLQASGCYNECKDVCTCDNKNGISTPRPDSGFAGDDSEVEYFDLDYLFLYH